MRGGGHTEADKGKQGFLESIMAAHPAMFERVTQKARLYRFQVLLSEVVEGDGGAPARLVRHGYRLDHEYFWPASAIKLCGAVAAVQRVTHLKQLLGVDMNCTTPITLYPLFEGRLEEKADPSNLDEQKITIAHEIRKLFLVSDTAAFNRLYDFVGHHAINRAMWSLGLLSVRLQHRLNVFWTLDENRCCSPVGLKLGDRTLTLPPKKSNLIVPDNSALSGIHVGTAYVTEDDQLVPEPLDFSKKNYISLLDLQNLLIKVARRDVELDSPPLRLAEGTRMMLMEAMSQYPSDSRNPKYNKSEYPDDYCKFFLPGLSRVRSKGALRIFNKPGRAYGFTVENSYVFDVERGRSFFLSAVIYTNRNSILNDNKYEYTDVADRLMADLGEVVARAVWQIPPCVSNLSSPFDCIPSSLWAACSCPLVQDSPQPVSNFPHNMVTEAQREEFCFTQATGSMGADAKVSDVKKVNVGCSSAGYVGADAAAAVVSSSRATSYEFELPVSEPLVPSCSDSSPGGQPSDQPSEPSIPPRSSSSADLPLSFHATEMQEFQSPAEQILSRLGSMSFADSFHHGPVGSSPVEPATVPNPGHLSAAQSSPANLDLDSPPPPEDNATLISEQLKPHPLDSLLATKTRSMRTCYRYFSDA